MCNYKTITIPGRGIMTLDVWIDKMNASVTPTPPLAATEASAAGAAIATASASTAAAQELIRSFYNEFTANPPDQPRTWELENTGTIFSFSSLTRINYVIGNRYSLGIFHQHSNCILSLSDSVSDNTKFI